MSQQYVTLPREDFEKLKETIKIQNELLRSALVSNEELLAALSRATIGQVDLAGAGAAVPASLEEDEPPTLIMKVESYETMSESKFQETLANKGRQHKTIDIGWSKLPEASLLLIPQYAVHLKNLVLPNTQLTDKVLKQIATHCTKIKILDLRFNSNMTPQALKIVAGGFPALKELQINQMKNVSKKDLEAVLTAHAPRLKFLMFVSIEGEHTGKGNTVKRNEWADGYQKLALCEKLENLFLERSGITVETLDLILPSIGKTLIQLSLSGLGITNSTAKAIGDNCKKLKILDLGLCGDAWNNTGLDHFTLIETLEELVLTYYKHNNTNNTAKGSLEVLKKMKNLKSLNLQGWNGITIPEIRDFLRQLPKMQEICTYSSSFVLPVDIQGSKTNVPKWLESQNQ